LPGKGKEIIPFARSKPKISQRAKPLIRPAVLSDLNYVRALGKKAFEPYGSYEDILARWFLSGFAVTLMAVSGKAPEGFAMFGSFQDEPHFSHVFELLAIAVEPLKRRRGLGSLLLAEVERKAKEQKGERLLLHTAVENAPAQRLFTKHGFTTLEVKSKFYPRGQNAILMGKRIS